MLVANVPQAAYGGAINHLHYHPNKYFLKLLNFQIPTNPPLEAACCYQLAGQICYLNIQ